MRFLMPLLATALAAAVTHPLAAQARALEGAGGRFLSWTAAIPVQAASTLEVSRPAPAQGPSVERVLLGGLIGAAAGALLCTVISNISDEAANERFTTCTAGGYLLFGGGGFAIGALIAAASD